MDRSTVQHVAATLGFSSLTPAVAGQDAFQEVLDLLDLVMKTAPYQELVAKRQRRELSPQQFIEELAQLVKHQEELLKQT